MPKSDTWPGSIAPEPSSTNMDSAGSCDSVISTNSGFSVDSLQHLSAAERECLMYLEETIDSLDVDDDSGLSNDEPETSYRAAATATHLPNIADQSGEDSGRDQRNLVHHGVPTPLLLANGFAALPEMAPADVHEPKTPEVPIDSHAPLQTETRDLGTSKTQFEVQAPDSTSCSLAPQAQMSASSVAGDGIQWVPSDTQLEPDQSVVQPETDTILIPPPSDFMDEPEPQRQPKRRPNTSQHVDLEVLRQRASTKRTSANTDVIHIPVPDKSVADVSESPSAPDSPTTSSPVLSEPRSPPAVAPKPKKLPSNIIFKSHKTSPDANFSPPANDGRMLSDAQKVRMEALRKLGLLKVEDTDSDQCPSPSPSSRRSWAAPSSPAAWQTPPSHTPQRVSHPIPNVPLSPPTGGASQQGNLALTPAALAKDVLPVPSAFSDTSEPPSRHHSGEASTAKSSIPEPITNTGTKSATLPHSGMGARGNQGSFEDHHDRGANHSLAELRNSRPRPASLGSGKDFSHAKVEDASTRRSVPVAPVSQNAAESVGVPRYHGVSVVICPQAEHDEGRRHALKRLGLLKD